MQKHHLVTHNRVYSDLEHNNRPARSGGAAQHRHAGDGLNLGESNRPQLRRPHLTAGSLGKNPLSEGGWGYCLRIW